MLTANYGARKKPPHGALQKEFDALMQQAPAQQASQPQRPPESELRGLLQQQFQEPKANWSQALGLLSGALKDYDGTFGQGNFERAQDRMRADADRQRADFDRQRQEQIMMAAASGDPFALAMMDPIGNRNFEYGKSRDMVGDERYLDQRDYGRSRDAVGDERYFDERDYSRGRDVVGDSQFDRSFGLQAELGRGQLGLNREQFDWQREQDIAQNANGANYGLNVVWGMDEQTGGYVPMQASKSGGLTPARMPEGVSALGPYGTAFDTEQGRAQARQAAMEGPAGQALAGFQTKAGELIELIDKAVDQSDFFNTGVTSYLTWSPDFNATLDSIGSRAFLSELISVKSQGGTFGALSDAEGRALRDAALNIKKSQSREQLVENLQRYKAQLQSSAANMQRAFEEDYVNNRAQRRPPGNRQSAAGAGASGEQTATNPLTGERLVLRNGQWVPFQ
jgi:hypothetical protein